MRIFSFYRALGLFKLRMFRNIFANSRSIPESQYIEDIDLFGLGGVMVKFIHVRGES